MIASFGDRATEDLYHGLRTRRVRRIPRDIWRVARRKLDMIEYAHILNDLAVPPGNRLEALKGDRAGCHSYRWRGSGSHGDGRLFHPYPLADRHSHFDGHGDG